MFNNYLIRRHYLLEFYIRNYTSKINIPKTAVFGKNSYLLVTFKTYLDTQKIGDGVL